jgi:hypothetical protein
MVQKLIMQGKIIKGRAHNYCLNNFILSIISLGQLKIHYQTYLGIKITF